jgi:hypothetical protein
MVVRNHSVITLLTKITSSTKIKVKKCQNMFKEWKLKEGKGLLKSF